MFKVFKTEVEKQVRKVIRIVKFDYGDEYYGRDTEMRKHMGSFDKYPQDCSIVAQYTMPNSPYQNGVAERRNRNLKDMMRSMMSRSKLQEFLIIVSLLSQSLKSLLGCAPRENPI